MQLVNIANSRRIIYLFLRDNEGKLKLRKIQNYYPYYYEPINNSSNWKEFYTGYFGGKYKKVVVNEPKEVREQRSEQSYESDIPFIKKYVIDNIDKFDKTVIKYAFIDIEILHDENEFPAPQSAKFPVSSISLYNSKYNKIRNWCLLDYGVPDGTKYSDLKNNPILANKVINAEIRLFKNFIDYLQKAKFDIIFGYYMLNFDYPYLFNRFSKLPQAVFFRERSKYNNFATAISPIGKVRGGTKEFRNFFPAGTSIIDYLIWYKLINKHKKSYALDYIMQEDLGGGKKFKNVNFSEINETVRQRNIGDVQGLVDIETKQKLIPYYDELRRFACVFWEDLHLNSRIIDSLILREAKKKEVILPKAHDIDKETFEGAFREAFQTGLFSGLGKIDLDSAYPRMIKDFCLDPSNIVKEKSKIKHNMIEIDGVTFQQNKNSILPTLADRLITLKTKMKKELKDLNPETQQYEDLEQYYKSLKSVVNSLYGVCGNRFFRLYDKQVAERVTYLVRKLLKDSVDYIENKLGFKVVYVDTDSCIYNSTKDISKELNEFIKQWGIDNFGNKNISTIYEFEGYYEDILILAKCRLKGFLNKNGQIKKEEVGIEAKRKDSSAFMSIFQTTLIDKIFSIRKKKETKISIIKWVKSEIKRIKTLPLYEIGFPCKISKSTSDYKVIPIFVRALKYTKELNPKFKKRIGELFYYTYVESMGNEIKIIKEPYNNAEKLTPKKMVQLALQHNLIKKNVEKLSTLKVSDKKRMLKLLDDEGLIEWRDKETKGCSKNVLAFDENNFKHVNNVSWSKMIDRNIISKCTVIFQAMGWDIKSIT